MSSISDLLSSLPHNFSGAEKANAIAKKILDSAQIDSQCIFEHALTNFNSYGRGCLMCIVEWSQIDQDGRDWLYLPLQKVKETEYQSAIDMVQTYNPKSECVLVVSIIISKREAKKGNADSWLNCRKISANSYLSLLHAVNPNFVRPKDENIGYMHLLCSNKSCVQVTTEKLKKCGACGGAQYCCRECQKTDWPNHKTICKQLKEAKSDIKQNSLQ